MVEKIFELQKSLIDQLFAKGKLPFNYPQHIDDPGFQDFLKSLAWNVIEEFTEAYNAVSDTDYIKELSDALHFLTELCIFSEVTPEVFNKCNKIPEFWDITIELGMAMNELKNRPWTKTFRQTDIMAYKAKISQSWSLLELKMRHIMGSDKSILDAFSSSYDKNKGRIENGY